MKFEKKFNDLDPPKFCLSSYAHYRYIHLSLIQEETCYIHILEKQKGLHIVVDFTNYGKTIAILKDVIKTLLQIQYNL